MAGEVNSLQRRPTCSGEHPAITGGLGWRGPFVPAVVSLALARSPDGVGGAEARPAVRLLYFTAQLRFGEVRCRSHLHAAVILPDSPSFLAPNLIATQTVYPPRSQAMKAHGQMVTGEAFNPIYHAVGNLIVGCGGFELETFIWIEGFCAADRGRYRDTKITFNTRKKRVLEIVNQLSISPAAKKGAQEVWDEVSQIMAFRNVIAHNPIIYRHDGPDVNFDESIRIPSMKEYKDGNFPDYTMKDIREQNEKLADLSKRLVNYRKAIEAQLGIELNFQYHYGDQTKK